MVETNLNISPSKGIPIPDTGKLLLVESEILGFGIRIKVQRILVIPITIEIQNPSSTDIES